MTERMTTPEELDALQGRMRDSVIDCETGVALNPGVYASLAHERVAELEAETTALKRRNADQHKIMSAHLSNQRKTIKRLEIETMTRWHLLRQATDAKAKATKRAEAAEAELARLRQGVQVKRVRHIKRGSTYQEVGRGQIQTGRLLSDCADVVIYQSEEDATFWVRPTEEFDDITRFEKIAALVSPDPEHPDDLAVDRFATVMKAKLAKKRADGRGGWEGPDCNDRYLSRLLREHVEKGDPLDVGNLAMMLHQRGERIVSPGDESAIKAMVSRFLQWKLPADFAPDGGISFKAVGNEGTPHEYRHAPVGTNLFNAAQAEAMIRHLLAAPPASEGGADHG